MPGGNALALAGAFDQDEISLIFRGADIDWTDPQQLFGNPEAVVNITQNSLSEVLHMFTFGGHLIFSIDDGSYYTPIEYFRVFPGDAALEVVSLSSLEGHFLVATSLPSQQEVQGSLKLLD